MVATLQLENSRYPDWTSVAQCYSAVLDALRMQPGIDAAGFSTAPVLEPGWRLPIGIEGRPAPRPEEAPIVQHVTVSTGTSRPSGCGCFRVASSRTRTRPGLNR